MRAHVTPNLQVHFHVGLKLHNHFGIKVFARLNLRKLHHRAPDEMLLIEHGSYLVTDIVQCCHMQT